MTEATTYITDLTPQNQYSNLTGIFEKIAAETHNAIDIHKLNETEWEKFLSENPDAPFSRTFGSDDLNESESGRQDVSWIQNSNIIEVTLITPMDEIKCTDQRIDSPVLKGNWFGSVSNLEIHDLSMNGNDLVQIDFEVDCKWPLLIKGGNPDAHSCFYISLAALDQSCFSIFEEFITHAAIMGCYTATKMLSLVMIDQKRDEAAVHLLSRCAMLYQDEFCTFLLAKKILKGEGITPNAGLAEFILCRLCIQKYTDAFFILGKLYLNGSEDKKTVKPMKKRAEFMLEKFVNDAIAYRGQDDEEIKEAIDLLEKEDFTPIPGEEDFIKEKEKQDDGENNEKDKESKASLIDWALAGTVVAAAGAAGAYAIGRILHHRH
ncbi:hypothetical protein M9Y10_004964 [Tritrichomonas musculus]|uniref:Uncharacterized protein n=1 Tax=Tritrichomonas musculus TaxID=1915356 RepID=A0ABR2JK59_9EUKA